MNFLLLVVALQAGDWQCSETDGLWRCESAAARPPAAPPRPSASAIQGLSRAEPGFASDTDAAPSSSAILATPIAPLPGEPAEDPLPPENTETVEEPVADSVEDSLPVEDSSQVEDSVPVEDSVVETVEDSVEESADETAEPAVVPQPDEALPEPEPALDASKADAVPAAVPAATAPPAAAPVAESPAEVSGFVVQVGAFREPAQAQAAARQIDLSSLVIMPTRRDGEDWYVVLLGAFPSYEEAREAGEIYAARVPGGSYWVRSAQDLRDVLNP